MTGTTFYGIEKLTAGSTSGATQAQTRLYNERLVLALVRRHGALTKAELSRHTALAPQTVTTLVNLLAAQGLLSRGEVHRGRMGQPAAPYAINARGAYTLGLQIGPSRCHLVLLDFLGQVIASNDLIYENPWPEEIASFVVRSSKELLSGADGLLDERVAGLGIASPVEGWLRQPELLPPECLKSWKERDLRLDLDRMLPWPVYLLREGMAFAAGELMFAPSNSRPGNFAAIHIGDFVEGGIALDYHLYLGGNSSAGDMGELMVPLSISGGFAKLNQVASLRALGRRIGLPGKLEEIGDWSQWGDECAAWLQDASEAIAFAIVNTSSLFDLDCAVIDGAVPAIFMKQLAWNVRRRLARLLINRPAPFTLVEGRHRSLARAIGAAAIPLLVNFSNDREILFKDWNNVASVPSLSSYRRMSS